MDKNRTHHPISISLLPVSPLGPVWLALTNQGLAALDIQVEREKFVQDLEKRGFKEFSQDTGKAREVARQLSEYLEGKRRSFDFLIDWEVLKPFQRQVLQATFAIPYGVTATYGEIAARVGKPRAARAVGRAEATNPMPLVIPCHRVLGSDGKLHGYGAAGGLATKAWLLQLEADVSSASTLSRMSSKSRTLPSSRASR
jgi:methylated-DNA-[protein]-cysteine S-methyltransferase